VLESDEPIEATQSESRAPFWIVDRPVTAQTLGLQTNDPWSNVDEEQDGWTPPILYPELHSRTHEVPDAKATPFAQALLGTPFWRADRPATVQPCAQVIDPAARVPVVHDGWAPDMVYPLLHLWSHETPEAQVPLFGQTVPKAPFVGAVRPVTVQALGAQVIVPPLRVPLVHVGWAPDGVYPLLHIWSHETPEAQVPLFGQSVPKAPFVGAIRLVTVQGLGEQVIVPPLRVPVVHVGCAPDIV